MAEPQLEGAPPEGIEVDKTSAYFGITESSDIVHDLMSQIRCQQANFLLRLRQKLKPESSTLRKRVEF